MNRTIRGIFFDLGWTLETPKNGDWIFTECYRSYIPEKVQVRIAQEDWDHSFEDAARILFRNHIMPDMDMEEEEFTSFYERITYPYPEIRLSHEDAKAIAHDHTYNFTNYSILKDTEDTIRRLKKEGYKVGIISDTWPSSAPQLKEEGLYDLFDCITFSCDLGVTKPDPRMYQDALKKMELPADATIFVDDLPGNLEAAASFGIHPVMSLAKPGSEPDPSFPYISSPSEIFRILKKYGQ